MNTINTKIDYISKTKSCTKITMDVKNHCQINPDLSWKFGYFARKFNFVRIFLDDNNSKTKDRKNLRSDFYLFQHIAHILCKDSYFWEVRGVGGGGLHIFTWDRPHEILHKFGKVPPIVHILHSPHPALLFKQTAFKTKYFEIIELFSFPFHCSLVRRTNFWKLLKFYSNCNFDQHSFTFFLHLT